MIPDVIVSQAAEVLADSVRNEKVETSDAIDVLKAIVEHKWKGYTGPFYSPHTGMKIQTGEWTHATLRDEDIIPCLMYQLETLWPAQAAKLTTEYGGEGWPYSQSGLGWGDPFDEKQRELAPDLCRDIYDSLEQLLYDADMQGWRIGSHPGDGSSIGIWMCEELEEELELEAFQFQLGSTIPNGAKILMVSDIMHGEGTHPTRIVLCHTKGTQPFATWYLCEPESGQKPFCVVGHYFSYEEFKEALADYWKRCDDLGVQQIADEILT